DCPRFPHPRLRCPAVVIPCGTTTFKQLSRLDTAPADLLHPASDVCRLPPAGFAPGLVASRGPGEHLHHLRVLTPLLAHVFLTPRIADYRSQGPLVVSARPAQRIPD